MAKMEVRYVGTTADFRGLTEADLKGWGIQVDLPDASPLARQYVQGMVVLPFRDDLMT